jgi:hypothetical protein
MDNEHEHQVPLQATSFAMSGQQDWTPESDCSKFSDGYEFDDRKLLTRPSWLSNFNISGRKAKI